MELEEKSLPITTTEKKTKPKDAGRIAAEKKLAEYNKKAREAKKAGREKEIPKENNQEGSFSLTQISSIGDGGSGPCCAKNPTQKKCAKNPT